MKDKEGEMVVHKILKLALIKERASIELYESILAMVDECCRKEIETKKLISFLKEEEKKHEDLIEQKINKLLLYKGINQKKRSFGIDKH